MLRLTKRPSPEWTDEAAALLRPYDGVLARLLHARGITTAAEADRFLQPSEADLHNPLLLAGMDKALALLKQAKAERWPVVIYGDYDVDGVCATVLLQDALKRFGIPAETHIPLRDEGYGLNVAAVEKLAESYRLLVTVDLGISNRAEVLRAQELGMRVIVTDHHQLALEECPADAVIDPLLGDYPCPRLCGTGVAFKVAQALLGGETAQDLMELAALATIADMVPLTGENRAITALGLKRLAATKRPGLRALMDIAHLSGPVRSDQVAFQLAPRLNAAGRLNDANLGVELLSTPDEARAKELATLLDTANTERRTLEGRMLEQAQAQVKETDFTRERILFVKGEDWHAGVIGLVAGRLCQQYACPVMALCKDGELLHGSLRSVAGVNIHRMLQACDDLLVRYGGHEMAAGATLRETDESEFRKRLNAAIAESSDEALFVPAQEYDLEAPFGLLDLKLCDRLDQLAPFGLGNPAPLLLTRGLSLERRRACGTGGAHLQVTLRDGGAMLDGIAFQMGALARALPDSVDAVYSLQKNEYAGRVRLQCDMKRLSPAQGALPRQLDGREADAEAQALLTSLIWQQSTQNETWARSAEGKSTSDTELYIDTDGVATRSACDAAQRGTLIVCRARETARALLRRLEGRVDMAVGAPDDPRCFPTVLLCPEEGRVSGCWRRVLLADGLLSDREAALWQARLPQARLIVRPISPALARLAASADAGDERYRALYRALRQSVSRSLGELAEAAGLTPVQARAGLLAFHQLGLADVCESPFSCVLLPPAPCALGDSPLLSALRRIQKEVLPC